VNLYTALSLSHGFISQNKASSLCTFMFIWMLIFCIRMSMKCTYSTIDKHVMACLNRDMNPDSHMLIALVCQVGLDWMWCTGFDIQGGLCETVTICSPSPHTLLSSVLSMCGWTHSEISKHTGQQVMNRAHPYHSRWQK
jgi:hypothetical protein